MDGEAQERMPGGEVSRPRVWGASWSKVTQRIIMSVEAPDYDTRVFKTSVPFLVIIMCGLAAISLLSLGSIWWSNSSEDWLLFWGFLIFYTLILAGLWNERVRRIARAVPTWDSNEALLVRAGAIVGDEALAPRAQTQPTFPNDAQDLAESVRVTGLYPPVTVIPDASPSVVAFLLVTASITFNFALLLNDQYRSPDPALAPVMLMYIGLLPVLVSVFVGIYLAHRPFSVAADAHGVSWRRGWQRRTLPWSEAQALCVIEAPPVVDWAVDRAGVAVRRIYWLQGRDGALTWASGPQAWKSVKRGEDAATLASFDAQAWRLCALAASRTGLPLRDLSATTENLAQHWPRLAPLRMAIAPGLTPPTSAAEQWRIATLRAIRRRRTRALFGLMAALEILLLVAGVTALVGVPLAYATQLHQAEASAPIFADTLAAPSGQWPTSASPDAPFAYIGGAYSTLAGNCCDLVALASTPRVRDGVVKVTVHQVSDFDLASAGIILRADTATHRALAFIVAPGGEWQLEWLTLSANGRTAQEGDSLLYEGAMFSVGAIHRGSDTVNQLAVIMRGASYAFFINGQYVGVYHDTKAIGERVGLYADGTANATAFTNFAIYPAPPASPLFPV